MKEREKGKAKRRHHIVNAATECFVKNGIHQTGIRDIARQANVSLGNLYNHFPGKDDLIAEIAVIDGQGLEEFANAIDASEDPLVAIREFLNHYLDYVSKAENAFLTIDIISVAIRNPTVAKQFESNQQRLIGVLSAAITRGISAGVMREQISIDETVRLLLDAVEGLGLRLGLAQLRPSENARKTLQDMIFSLLLTRSE